MFTFVDDDPVTVPDEDLTWQASHTLVAKQCYLGLQDAARKARPSSKQPGARAGAIGHAGCLCAHFCEKVGQDYGNLGKRVGPTGGGKAARLGYPRRSQAVRDFVSALIYGP